MKEKKRYNTKKLSPQVCQAIEEQVAELAEIIVSANYFVVDVVMEEEQGRWYLRIFLDHPNPAVRVSLADCADISEALDPLIESQVEALIDFPYSLEVSSPGLFRKLTKPREFTFYRGRRIELAEKGELPFIAYLQGYDAATEEILYSLNAQDSNNPERKAWDSKKLGVSLSPDLTEQIETKVVPRRIERYD